MSNEVSHPPPSLPTLPSLSAALSGIGSSVGRVPPTTQLDESDFTLPPLFNMPQQKKKTRKTVRLNVRTLSSLLQGNYSFFNLPIWSKIDRIIYAALGVESSGEVYLYPKSSNSQVLQSPETYICVLRQLSMMYGIQIYIGTPTFYLLESFSNHNTISPIQHALTHHGEEFWHNLSKMMLKYAFQGVELNLELLNLVPTAMLYDITNFMFRGSTIFFTKNSPDFVLYYKEQLKALSEQVEAIGVNSYGFLKFQPLQHAVNGRMYKFLPKCECNYLDLVHVVRVYNEIGVSSDKLCVGIETTGLMYFMDMNDPTAVETVSVVPLHTINSLLNNSQDFKDDGNKYIPIIDRENEGCMLECKNRQVRISYDNQRMKILKFKFCSDEGIGSCVTGNPDDDVHMLMEDNLINLMNKYI